MFKGKGFIDHLENDMVFKAIQQNKGERNLSKQGFVSTCLVPSCKMFIIMYVARKLANEPEGFTFLVLKCR